MAVIRTQPERDTDGVARTQPGRDTSGGDESTARESALDGCDKSTAKRENTRWL